MELDSNGKGAVAEAEIAAAAVRLGFQVARPMPDGQRYDLLIDTGERILRVQCKWAPRVKDVLYIRPRTSRHTPRGYVWTVYSSDEIDAVAAYSPDTDTCYLLPIKEIAGRRYISLRLEPPLNNQAAKLNWADQYRFGAVAQLEERERGTLEAAGSSPASSIADLGEDANGHARTDRERESQIGVRLAAERKRRAWSQRAISRRTGIAPSVISRLERGERDPRLSVIERYAACLGYAVEYQLIPCGQADRGALVVVSQ